MKRKIGTCIVSLLMTAVMVWHAPLAVLAREYYIDCKCQALFSLVR